MFRVFFQMLMRGRYGFDKLGRFLLLAGLFCELAAILLRQGWLVLPLQTLGFVLMVLTLMRMFSRNTLARAAEARRFQVMSQRWAKRWQRLRKGWPRFFNGEYLRERRQYKFLRCPRCAARLRVPRGKGHIIISCPRCAHKIDSHS